MTIRIPRTENTYRGGKGLTDGSLELDIKDARSGGMDVVPVSINNSTTTGEAVTNFTHPSWANGLYYLPIRPDLGTEIDYRDGTGHPDIIAFNQNAEGAGVELRWEKDATTPLTKMWLENVTNHTRGVTLHFLTGTQYTAIFDNGADTLTARLVLTTPTAGEGYVTGDVSSLAGDAVMMSSATPIAANTTFEASTGVPVATTLASGDSTAKAASAARYRLLMKPNAKVYVRMQIAARTNGGAADTLWINQLRMLFHQGLS